MMHPSCARDYPCPSRVPVHFPTCWCVIDCSVPQPYIATFEQAQCVTYPNFGVGSKRRVCLLEWTTRRLRSAQSELTHDRKVVVNQACLKRERERSNRPSRHQYEPSGSVTFMA